MSDTPVTISQMRSLLRSAAHPRTQLSDALAWDLQVTRGVLAYLEAQDRYVEALEAQVNDLSVRLERACDRLEKRLDHVEGVHGA